MDIYDSSYCFRYKDGTKEFLTLSESEENQLVSYIRHHLQARKTINTKHSSYGLKHLFEKRLGFYVSNADCKKAMMHCGYNAKKWADSPNWCFNVSERSLSRIYDMKGVI